MLAFVLVLGLFLWESPALAVTYTWTGGDGTDGEWSNASNWGGVGVRQDEKDVELIFPPLTGPYESHNDLTGIEVTSLRVTTLVGGGDYRFTGNAITLSGPATMANPGAGDPNLVWQIPVVLGADVTISTSGRQTQLQGTIDLGSETLTLGAAGDILLVGAVGGSGSLVKNGGSALTIVGANTYTGPTTSNGGALYIGGPEALGDSATGTTFNSGFLGFFPGANFTSPEPLVFHGGSIVAYGTSTIAANVRLDRTINVDAVEAETVLTMSGTIEGNGGVNKVGPGLLILNAPTNSYAGATIVAEGTLQIDSALSSTAVTVGNSAILQGNGSSAGTIGVQDGGTIAPGSSPGEISSQELNLTPGAIFAAEIGGPNPVDEYDTLSVAGPLRIGGAELELSLAYVPSAGQQFTLISQGQSQPVIGTFAGLAEGTTFTVDGTMLAITYMGGSGNDVVLAVPTPTPTSTPTVTPTHTFGVRGRIHYYRGDRSLAGAQVELLGAPPETTTSDADGIYTLPVVAEEMRTLQPRKTGDFGQAISSLDSALVKQIVVGIATADPYQALAADVTGNGTITSLDAARITQFRLGMITKFAVASNCGSDWVFIPDPSPAGNQTLVQPQISPGSCQPGGIQFNPLVTPVDGQDFIAILFGDPTGNWLPAGP